MNNDRRAFDLAETVGDVIAVEQTIRRCFDRFSCVVLPFSNPLRTLDRLSDDDASNDGSLIWHWSVLHPSVNHHSISSQSFFIVIVGCRVNQHESRNSLRCSQRGTQR